VEGEVVFEAGHREGQQTRPDLAGEFRRRHSGHGPAPLYVFFRFRDHTSRAKTMRTNVTVMAPPMRVAICANGMSCMRLAAMRMPTSPVPPWPLWHAFTIAVSIGYIPSIRPTNAPVPIRVATVATMVMRLGKLNAAISLSHGVIETPIANSSG